MLTTLTDQERRAINDYLAENWADFCSQAVAYLDDEEIDELGNKLGTEQ